MNLNNVTLPLGLKKCFYIAPKAIFSRYLQCFLHITHPKGCMQHSTKNSKIELPCKKNAFFYANASPQTCARSNLSRWGLKKCFYIAPKVSRYLQCFLHITHPKGYMQHSTKNSKIELPCRKNAFFFTRMHPRKHAQEAIFPVIYSVFLHISNTDFDPQKSANHRAPPTPPWLPQKKRLTFPTLSVITLVPILFLLVFLLFFWLSCFGSRCLRGCCELVDVVGASLLGLSWGTPSWGLCWSILGLC